MLIQENNLTAIEWVTYKSRRILLSLFYKIRNHQNVFYQNAPKFKYWELKNPLTIKYQKSSYGYYCHKCDEHHLEKSRNFESSIWSNKLNYVDTLCVCEDILFQPLEDYKATGGEEGNPLVGGSGYCWRLNEKK
jgi:hypothetical protein